LSKDPIFGPGQRPIEKPSAAEPSITNVVKGAARPLLETVPTPPPAPDLANLVKQLKSTSMSCSGSMDFGESDPNEEIRRRLCGEAATAIEALQARLPSVPEKRVVDGPACPTCGFRIVSKKPAPYIFDDEVKAYQQGYIDWVDEPPASK
jgi:DNA-directed RNA polymerase subunit RPC12/RpoP